RYGRVVDRCSPPANVGIGLLSKKKRHPRPGQDLCSRLMRTSRRIAYGVEGVEGQERSSKAPTTRDRVSASGAVARSHCATCVRAVPEARSGRRPRPPGLVRGGAGTAYNATGGGPARSNTTELVESQEREVLNGPASPRTPARSRGE